MYLHYITNMGYMGPPEGNVFEVSFWIIVYHSGKWFDPHGGGPNLA